MKTGASDIFTDKRVRRGNRTKQKIRKWIDMPEFGRYETFVVDWHFLCAGCRIA